MNTEDTSAEEIITLLKLEPLPFEGGFFRRTYECSEMTTRGGRHLGTAIYYLVTKDNFSALHRVCSDELFHFYAGDTVEMIQIEPGSHLTRWELGADLPNGQVPQVLVPKNHWQGLRVKAGGQWALLGTTVAPGFAYEDFELGKRSQLLQEFPSLESWILDFTRL